MSSGLAKRTLQGIVNGKGEEVDRIKEWTGTNFVSSIRADENRIRWKGMVSKSSVVPRRPSRVAG